MRYRSVGLVVYALRSVHLLEMLLGFTAVMYSRSIKVYTVVKFKTMLAFIKNNSAQAY